MHGCYGTDGPHRIEDNIIWKISVVEAAVQDFASCESSNLCFRSSYRDPRAILLAFAGGFLLPERRKISVEDTAVKTRRGEAP